jgi:FkbM family methyltransferase
MKRGLMLFGVALALSCRQDSGVDLDSEPLYSQHKEELLIRDFFGDRREGFFLDVGCATPIRDSNTYYLEKHLGWSGIAVDGLPEYQSSWERRRPKSRFFNYLVTDHTDTVEPFYRSELPGISSMKKPLKGPAGKERAFEEIQVPTTTLTRLLEENQVSSIDLLSIDIEGAEPLALAGFDVDRFQPELAVIEAKPANRETIVRYFTDHGYEQIERYLEHDPVNYYFAPKARNRP